MELKPGAKLGAYEIVSAIGKGGMGEVWRAHDPQLGRDVAIKVSAQQFTDRFEREARAIAALNHANVCTLYHIGPNYLVMEYIDGATLAERIKEGPISLEEAIRIAKQIADALEAAHEKSIVHRDLKPANIKIRRDGSVKVLDFGLAKAGEAQQVTADSPTMMPDTRIGMILGTAGYMAPEQARGKEVDKRADIWAFGVVLYEMVTGKQLFSGETITDILAGVLTKEPDLTAVPPRLRRVIATCLEKDPRNRVRDIGDWSHLVEGASAPVAQSAKPLTSKLPWAVAALVALIAAALGFIHFREQPPVERPLRLSIPLPENSRVSYLELSPDGRRLILGIGRAENTLLYMRPLDSGELRPLPGTENARTPFWSADSRYIAFFAENKLKVIPAGGGPARVLCESTGLVRGGSWSREGTILFAGDGKLKRVDSRGGPCSDLGKPEPEAYVDLPMFMPDGKHYFYVSSTSSGERGLYLATLDEPKGRKILEDRSSVVYTPPISPGGHSNLLFLRESTLMAQPFDDSRLQAVGDPFPVASQASSSSVIDQVGASASADGTLVYLAGASRDAQLTWFDRTGKEIGQLGSRTTQSTVSISPSGNSAIVLHLHQDGDELWLYDLAHGGSGSRLIPRGDHGVPLWSPDSARLWVHMKGTEGDAVYLLDIHGGRQDVFDIDQLQGPWVPADWSRDGRFIVINEINPETRDDIAYLPVVSGKLGAPVKFLATPADETQGQFSPDGKWLAYTSDESGRYEIYARLFPLGSEVWKVSTEGGREPRWSADGKELFFVGGNQSGWRMMAAALGTDGKGGLRFDMPQTLFDYRANLRVPQSNIWSYSPHPDGKRFLVNVSTEGQGTVNVILHWQNAVGETK